MFFRTYPIFKSSANAILFLLVLSLLGQAQETEQKDVMETETSKTAYESWQEYVDRLVDGDFITSENRDSWSKGEEVRVEKSFSLTRYRGETRTRTINVNRVRMEKRDGIEVQVPYTELVTQNYVVTIPYTELVNGSIVLPGKGIQEDDATYPGFLNSEGQPFETKPQEPPQPKDLPAPKDPVKDSRKSHKETWKEYVQRLVEEEFISQQEAESWSSGNPLTVEKLIPVTIMRNELRTRLVDKTKMVEETNDDGETVTRPRTEKVSENYTVAVPYAERINMMLDFPAPGLLDDSIEFDGFLRPFISNSKLSLEEQETELVTRTSKSPTENWEDYLNRLNKDRFVTSGDIVKWRSGSSIKVQKSFELLHMEQRTRTRTITVISARTETDENGDEVIRQVPEEVEQTYVVSVPYRANLQGAFGIPGKGSRQPDDSNSGFFFRKASEKAPDR